MQASVYDESQIQVLEGMEAVRKRPGMYIGPTDINGLHTMVREVVDNSVDEVMAGRATAVEVIIHDDGSVTVRDDGQGIPVGIHPKMGISTLQVVMTVLHAGGKFGGGSYTASGGLHGVGASVVNALSERLDVEVDRDGLIHQMSFRRGTPGFFDGEGPKAAFSKKSGLRNGGKVNKKVTGTRIRWWSDRQIFIKEASLELTEIYDRARQTTFLIPGLAIEVRDERKERTIERFQSTGGIAEYCEFLAPDSSLCDPIRIHGNGHFTESVPVLDEQSHMVTTDVDRDVVVDIALRWGNEYDTVVKSFVNIIATPKGGTHVTGFERSVTKSFNEALRSAKLLKTSEPDVIKDDVLEGLTGVITVRLAEPQFEGQTKEVLGTNAVTRIVSHVVSAQLKHFFNSSKRNEKAAARMILEKVANAARTRVAARAHKELQRRKTALESSSLPAKLSDCRSDDVLRTELFIVEGDSALGTAKQARNSEVQAILPIRGKILNVQKASLGDMLKNSECASIIQVIGAGSGRSFDLEAVRYGRIILMSDADVDGAHIRCLLLTLIHRYMRPLLDDGRVFAAVPPLHRIEVIGGKKGEYIYTYSDAEMRKTLADLDKKNKRWKEPIQRYKGLGEMDSDQLRETTMDSSHRTLRRITGNDIEAAEKVFELLMGNDVAPRKEFIIESAAEIDRERIDA